ncbi:MAG: hypothetical protein SFZ24_07095 [Planctomycetota bacterium]|nr:hypothetical protein [Planctomycetota bacterium]
MTGEIFLAAVGGAGAAAVWVRAQCGPVAHVRQRVVPLLARVGLAPLAVCGPCAAPWAAAGLVLTQGIVSVSAVVLAACASWGVLYVGSRLEMVGCGGGQPRAGGPDDAGRVVDQAAMTRARAACRPPRPGA